MWHTDALETNRKSDCLFPGKIWELVECWQGVFYQIPSLLYVACCTGSSTIGHWSEWGPWSVCSASCNGGTQTRTRRCVWDMSCPGSNIQRRICNEASCPIRKWPWTTKQTTCFGLDHRKIMAVTCSNKKLQISLFLIFTFWTFFLLAATWGPWSMWSGCSRSCGEGRRTRLRTCRHGNTCVGLNQQFEPCNSQRCPVGMLRHA